MMTKQGWIRMLIMISRMVLGVVFIFSGYVKGVDPMGSAFKFEDYFIAFNMGFLEFLTVPLAFVLCAAEFLIGISLLLNLRFRLVSWVILLFMSCFTVLTLYIALTDPVSDCGCFGDAVIMTNWQTFFKNVILMFFVVPLFLLRGYQKERNFSRFEWTGLAVFAFLFLGMEWHVYRHLPWMDFRPYSVGTYIPEKMIIPEGAPQDVYNTILYYEKNGEVREFTEDNFPWQDTTWTYVDSKHVLVRKGYEPPIHDFTIVDSLGTDITSRVLSYPGLTFLLISNHLDEAAPEALRYADELHAYCGAAGHPFYCLTASGDAEVLEVKQELGLGFPTCTTDDITLKTIIRSNPGLLLLREGTILAKWHYHDFPGVEEITTRGLPFVLTRYRSVMEARIGIISLLVLIMAGLLYYLVLPVRRPT